MSQEQLVRFSILHSCNKIQAEWEIISIIKAKLEETISNLQKMRVRLLVSLMLEITKLHFQHLIIMQADRMEQEIYLYSINQSWRAICMFLSILENPLPIKTLLLLIEAFIKNSTTQSQIMMNTWERHKIKQVQIASLVRK